MKHGSGMNTMRAMLLGLALAAAACGGEKSVASKSGAADRETQAKGATVGGGHEHGGEAATSTTAAMDHSAHGTSTDAHAGMNHGAAAGGGAMDHSAHGAPGAVDHAAMGHANAANAHAGHDTATPAAAASHAAMGDGTTASSHAGHGTATPAGAADHAAMGHGATQPSATGSHAQHPQTTTAAQTDHSQHGAMQTSTATGTDAHAQHGVTATAPPATPAAAPRSSAEMQRVQPAATLRSDAFDAPAAISVSEAAKAARGGGHEGHQTRGITPGQDRENPPAPMPATRDGRTGNTPPAADHSQHGAPAPPAKKNQ